MKLQSPFLLCLCLAVALYCSKKRDGHQPSPKASASKNYRLVVDRGAFHYDKFILTSDKIEYHPNSDSQVEDQKYNGYSETLLDSSIINSFFEEIEEKGFWNLNHRYEAYTSCSSELKITLTINEKTKTVICDDYNAYCHDLIKYIVKKVVELEGNDLKRIYLPG